MTCPECHHRHGADGACMPPFADQCVICDAPIGPEDSGLCNAHKYDEQLVQEFGQAIPEATGWCSGGTCLTAPCRCADFGDDLRSPTTGRKP